jgi:hypothetical protein
VTLTDGSHTRVGHIQESSGCVSLNTHIIRPRHPCQRNQSAGLGNLGLIFIMSGKICNASDGITLDFNVRAQHLANQWLQSTQPDDKQLVLGYKGA